MNRKFKTIISTKHGELRTTQAIYMRKTGDTRKDTVVKREIYEEHIKGKYNVLGVFDDRKNVQRMWVNQGLFVFSVNQLDKIF